MKKQGFTLIELLVVIAIIGLLSTLAVVSLGTARTKARDAKRLSDVKAIQTAMEMAMNDNGGTVTTTNLGSYIQGGFPTPTNGATYPYYICIDAASGVNKYLVGAKLEGTYQAGSVTTDWTGSKCSAAITSNTVPTAFNVTSAIDCDATVYCSGSNN